jgi:hypothetical protein
MRDPESRAKCNALWIPAFAGMTIPKVLPLCIRGYPAHPRPAVAAKPRHNRRATSALAISLRTPYLWNGAMQKR